MSTRWRVACASAAVAASVLSFIPAEAAAVPVPVPGRFCKASDAGLTLTYNGVKVTCTRDGKRHRWYAGVPARAIPPGVPRAAVGIVAGAVCTNAQIGRTIPAQRLRCTFMGSKNPPRWVLYVPGAIAGITAG